MADFNLAVEKEDRKPAGFDSYFLAIWLLPTYYTHTASDATDSISLLLNLPCNHDGDRIRIMCILMKSPPSMGRQVEHVGDYVRLPKPAILH